MSVRIMDRVWRRSPARQGDLLVLLAIADFADDDGECWPCIARLATKCRMSVRSVQRAIRSLVETGELKVEIGAGAIARGGKTSRYTVLTPCQNDTPSDCHPVTNRARPGDKSGINPVTRVSPITVIEPSIEPPVFAQGSLRKDAQDEFEQFWKRYPKKKSKQDALKAWKQTARTRPSTDRILAAIDQAKKCDQWTKDEGQFIPYPATWLRSGGWDDEPFKPQSEKVDKTVDVSEIDERSYAVWWKAKYPDLAEIHRSPRTAGERFIREFLGENGGAK